jgi:UDP-glucuronate 4-epimerase
MESPIYLVVLSGRTRYLFIVAAVFIVVATSQKLPEQCHTVIDVDNLNYYHDVNLKHSRLAQFEQHEYWT